MSDVGNASTIARNLARARIDRLRTLGTASIDYSSLMAGDVD